MIKYFIFFLLIVALGLGMVSFVNDRKYGQELAVQLVESSQAISKCIEPELYARMNCFDQAVNSYRSSVQLFPEVVMKIYWQDANQPVFALSDRN